MPVQVWPQETKLQASYELLNIWLVVPSWSTSRCRVRGQAICTKVTDPVRVGIVLPTPRLSKETAIFPDVVEPRTSQWVSSVPGEKFGQISLKSAGGSAAAHGHFRIKRGP